MIPIAQLDLVKIGEILKTHGYKGEAVIKLSVNFERLHLTELIFLIIDGNKVPFFFSNTPKPYKKNGLLVKLDNVDTDSEIEKLINTPVFIESKNIAPETVEDSPVPENFDVYNGNTYIGQSGTYLNIPSNPILTVYTKDGKEILIPVNEQFLKSIDYEKNIIIFDLPEGLIDVNE